jgi:2-(1,2-epoxy-1,2-dihydrophenyl)acetyl-CoA isomerase
MTSLETGTDHLLADVADGVGLLTLNRPERRNALSDEMLQAMGGVLRRFETDEAVRCVVVTGAGGAFCAGGDVKGMAEQNSGRGTRRSVDEIVARQRLNQRETSGRLWSMPKPTIACIPGPAAGAGLSIALACDLRYAAKGAVLTTAFARVGFSGDYGGTWFLSRLVGAGKAKELYYFSERVTAEEAQILGIVNAVFDTDELVGAVMDRARKFASGPAVAYRYMKENLNRAFAGAEPLDCLDLEATHHVHTGLTEDHREAAQAFVEKREPRFIGR